MSVAGGRNWANLPSDLVCSISQLLKVSDYFRFRAVCSWWDSESAPPCIRHPPEMPFLLLLGEGDDGDNDDCCTLVNFSDPDRRRRSMGPIPEMRGKWLIGSQNGWIGLLDEHSEVSFLNPLTRVQIRLPSVTTIAHVNPIYDDTGTNLLGYHHAVGRNNMEVYNSLHHFRRGSFKKIVLSSTPMAGGGYAAMAIFSNSHIPAFAAEGSGKWELLDGAPTVFDIIYRDGKFLTVDVDGGLWVLDPTSPPRMKMITHGWDIEAFCSEKYLVDCSGDLLQVWKGFDLGNTDEADYIVLMKFNPKQAEWVPFRNLGEYSLFLGLSYSISLSSREVPEMKPNCIYFTEVVWVWVNDESPYAKTCKLRTRSLFVFNLEDDSFDHYHPPDDRLNWPPPLWRRSMGPIPEMRGKWLLGSQNGWIGLLDEYSEVSFLNPLTRVQIRLPSVTTIAHVKPIYDDTGTTLLAYHHAVGRNSMEEYNSLHFFRRGSFKKIVLSSTPMAGGGYAAMAIFSNLRIPAFAAEGSGKWELIDDVPNVFDIIYHDGKFLTVDLDGGLWVLDPISPPRMKMIAQGWDMESFYSEKYLVDCSGDLLQVWKGFGNYIELMKFNPKQAEWVPFTNLGDYSLFLGLSYSISLSSREVPEMKPNCIYFIEILWDWVNDETPYGYLAKLQTHSLFVFNLEDESFDQYHPPDDRLNWPPPLWYTPSLL